MVVVGQEVEEVVHVVCTHLCSMLMTVVVGSLGNCVKYWRWMGIIYEDVVKS
jgi:hypothetical protein